MQAFVGTIVCKFGGDPVLFVVEEAIFMKAEKCPYHVSFDLDLEHTLDAGPRGATFWKFGGDPVLFVVEAIFVTSEKCPYHVPLTLTLSTPWMQVHVGTIVCKFGGDPVMFVVEIAICAKKFTDRWTDGRRTARDCISSLVGASTPSLGPARTLVRFIDSAAGASRMLGGHTDGHTDT